MKTVTATFWISLLLGTVVLSANEQLSVDQQIAAMQQATPQERVKLMNQFKQQLATMNAQEREKSISQLREQMKHKEQQGTSQHQKTEMHTEAQRDQMQQNEKMQRMEQMQQRHGGDQYMHEMEKEMEQKMDDPGSHFQQKSKFNY